MRRAAPTQEAPRDEWWPYALGAGGALALAMLFWPRKASASAAYYAGPVVPGGRVLSRFGPRTKQGVTRPHWGIDLRAHVGTPIHAAAAGVVMAVYPDGRVQGYGNLVVIKHRPGEGSLYAHMDQIDPLMVAGAPVAAGQAVGTVGCTDSEGGFDCNGSHLHFEVLTPAPDRDGDFLRVRGGDDPVPTRENPETWATRNGVALV